VLVIDGDEPGLYIASFAGLTVLGGAIAVVINLLAPPAPVSSLKRLDRHVREQLAEYLGDLSDQLTSQDDHLDPASGRASLVSSLSELLAVTERTADARRINLRSKSHASRASRQYRYADQLERLVYVALTMGEAVRRLRR